MSFSRFSYVFLTIFAAHATKAMGSNAMPVRIAHGALDSRPPLT